MKIGKIGLSLGIFVGLLTVGIGFALIYFYVFPEQNNKFWNYLDSKFAKTIPVPPDNSVIIPLQKVTNVGYVFYLGQIDYPGSPDISDTLKNDVTDIIYKSNFPKSLLSNMAIVFVNTLAVTPDQYIGAPGGKIKVKDFPPDFMYGGGIYSQVGDNQISIIFINKNFTELSKLRDVLTHELGHHVGFQLTREEWSAFYKLRKIPQKTPLQTSDWLTSPIEDFAEVYKNIYTGLKIHTAYSSVVDEATKKFIQQIISRLN